MLAFFFFCLYCCSNLFKAIIVNNCARDVMHIQERILLHFQYHLKVVYYFPTAYRNINLTSLLINRLFLLSYH